MTCHGVLNYRRQSLVIHGKTMAGFVKHNKVYPHMLNQLRKPRCIICHVTCNRLQRTFLVCCLACCLVRLLLFCLFICLFKLPNRTLNNARRMYIPSVPGSRFKPCNNSASKRLHIKVCLCAVCFVSVVKFCLVFRLVGRSLGFPPVVLSFLMLFPPAWLSLLIITVVGSQDARGRSMTPFLRLLPLSSSNGLTEQGTTET